MRLRTANGVLGAGKQGGAGVLAPRQTVRAPAGNWRNQDTRPALRDPRQSNRLFQKLVRVKPMRELSLRPCLTFEDDRQLGPWLPDPLRSPPATTVLDS